MNYSKYRFNLDMQSYISQVSLPVRQHDTGIILRINLTDGGVPYRIKDGCRAVFYARKADGSPLMNDCVIEKNTTICYELTQQTTACSGVVDCEVRLYGSDGNLITTPRFILVIDSRVVHDEDFPLSDSEQTVLDNIILSEQERIKAEAERERASAEALAKANQAEELVDELIERLKVEDIGDEELRIHNENAEAHSNAFNAHNNDPEAHSFENERHNTDTTAHQKAFNAHNDDMSAHKKVLDAHNESYAAHVIAFNAHNNDTTAHKKLFGTGNVIYANDAVAVGAYNRITADAPRSLVGGTYSTATAPDTLTFGDSCKNNHQFATLLGYFLESSAQRQLTCGMFSKASPNALFVVGNGKNKNERANAFEVLKDGTIVTPYGSPMHMVSGSYIGTGLAAYYDPVVLTFDMLPDILFMTSPQKIIFPKVNSDPDVIVKNNTITLKTATNIYNTVSTVYHYLAFYSTTPIVQDEKGVSFTVRRVDGNGIVYNDPGPEEFLVEQGTTWREFLEGIRRTDSQYGVGTTTGRVYWKVYDAYEHGPARSAYLRDSNGNYVLGTDVIKEETYTSWYVFNGEYGVTPPLT